MPPREVAELTVAAPLPPQFVKYVPLLLNFSMRAFQPSPT